MIGERSSSRGRLKIQFYEQKCGEWLLLKREAKCFLMPTENESNIRWRAEARSANFTFLLDKSAIFAVMDILRLQLFCLMYGFPKVF